MLYEFFYVREKNLPGMPGMPGIYLFINAL